MNAHGIEAAAARLAEEVETDHAEHAQAMVRTVGVMVAVEYEDAESGERRTRTHYRFAESPDFRSCPTYVALGLASLVAKDVTS